VLLLLLGMLVEFPTNPLFNVPVDVLVEFPTNPLVFTVQVDMKVEFLKNVRIITMDIHLVHHLLLLLLTNKNLIPMKDGLKFAMKSDFQHFSCFWVFYVDSLNICHTLVCDKIFGVSIFFGLVEHIPFFCLLVTRYFLEILDFSVS